MKFNQVKTPEKVIYYKPAKEEEESGGGSDIQQFFSFILCFGGILLKYKILIWMSLFLMISSFATLKHRSDYKQFIINAGMCIMGMVSLYAIQPPIPKTT